jgi:hypothetical protein
MSGGHFDYIQFRFEEIADEIDRLISTNNKKNDYGHSRDFNEKTLNKFREASYTIRRTAEMATRIDWLVSGDDGEESFHERWEEEVRKAPEPQ